MSSRDIPHNSYVLPCVLVQICRDVGAVINIAAVVWYLMMIQTLMNDMNVCSNLNNLWVFFAEESLSFSMTLSGTVRILTLSLYIFQQSNWQFQCDASLWQVSHDIESTTNSFPFCLCQCA